MRSISPCNLCSGSDTEFYCRKESIDVVRCRNCGLIYTSEARDRADMVEHYSERYFEPYLKTVSLHEKKRFRRRMQEIKKIRFPGALLDVGCGMGFFLKLAADEGYKVSGVELSRLASEYARANFRLDIFTGELKDAPLARGTFDVITLWHVLEHVTNPKGLLASTNELLKPHGLLAIEVPNIKSIAARISGTDWELMAPNEHFFYFDPLTISRLLQETGFNLLKTQSYFWTTPKMILRARAESTKGLGSIFFKLGSFFLSLFSPLRFRTMPVFIQGDVVTVYAYKVKNLFTNQKAEENY